MIFTTKAEYGVRLLIQLGRQGSGHPVSLKAIAEAENLPLAYLRADRRAAQEGRASWQSTRGAHGGYVLARPAEEITMDAGRCSRSRARSRRWTASSTTTTARVLCSHGADGEHCATKLLWTRVQMGVITLAAAHHARRARRVRRVTAPHRNDSWRYMAELEIKNLHVTAGDKQILKGVDLHVRSGEFHALMGPNGSGKSTLANAIMGHPNLEVTEGQILFDGEDITEADPDERARAGLFMAFQYPVAIPGVTVAKYLRMVMNAHREARGEPAISLKDFRKTVEAAMELTHVPREFSNRYLNDGFSGGEKKRMEILQLALLKPRLAVLDETDSGLDIDALNTVAAGVNTVAEGSDMGVLIITHYQRILHMVKPQFVHIMFEGRIVKEGGPELVDGAREARLRLDPRRGRRARHEPRRSLPRRSSPSSRARAWSTSTRPRRRRRCGR